MTETATQGASLTIDFAGEIFHVAPGEEFVIGRHGDLALEDNPFLHRRFVVLSHDRGLWWVRNAGTRLSLSLSDGRRLMRTVLAPGAQLPLVFPFVLLTFSAGPTAYEVRLSTRVDGFSTPALRARDENGESTIGPDRFTPSQRLLMLALAEPVLRRAGSGASQIPASSEAAARLGWSITRFNRKLDNVCDKLTNVGVRGLRGSEGEQATNRRAALVEYAVSSLLVRVEDLPLIEAEKQSNSVAVQTRSASSSPTGASAASRRSQEESTR